MRKKIRDFSSAALAACMMLSALHVGRVRGGAGGGRTGKWRERAGGCCCAEEYIAINEKNFPDKNFRDYVAGEWDKNGDNRFSLSEIANAKWITCDNKEISNLKGIQFFTNIWLLECYYDNLTTIETIRFEQNKNLSKINCIYNKLERAGCKRAAAIERVLL